MVNQSAIPAPSLRRLPLYYRRLQQAIQDGEDIISSQALGEAAGVPAAQVRKDIGHLGEYGRPGVGYDVPSLTTRLEEFLGLVSEKRALIVGVGNLGRALASYPGFTRYGLHLRAVFDADPAKVGTTVAGLQIQSLSEIGTTIQQERIQMGIVTVPAPYAQEVADILVENGISVIWNFAPTSLVVPDSVLLQSVDLATELATLSHRIVRHRMRQIDPRA